MHPITTKEMLNALLNSNQEYILHTCLEGPWHYELFSPEMEIHLNSTSHHHIFALDLKVRDKNAQGEIAKQTRVYGYYHEIEELIDYCNEVTNKESVQNSSLLQEVDLSTLSTIQEEMHTILKRPLDYYEMNPYTHKVILPSSENLHDKIIYEGYNEAAERHIRLKINVERLKNTSHLLPAALSIQLHRAYNEADCVVLPLMISMHQWKDYPILQAVGEKYQEFEKARASKPLSTEDIIKRLDDIYNMNNPYQEISSLTVELKAQTQSLNKVVEDFKEVNSAFESLYLKSTLDNKKNRTTIGKI